MNLRSSHWLGFQVEPFWDLNKEPNVGWVETVTCSASGLFWVWISTSPTLDIQAL